MCPKALRVIFEGFRRQYAELPKSLVAVVASIGFALPLLCNVLVAEILVRHLGGPGFFPEDRALAVLYLGMPSVAAFFALVTHGLDRISAEFSSSKDVGVLQMNRGYAVYFAVSFASLFVAAFYHAWA